MATGILETLRSLGVTVKVIEGQRVRLEPASKVPADLIPRIRAAKAEIIAALRRPVCDCRRLPHGEPVHRPDCPVVAEMRKYRAAVWLQDAQRDPAGHAVSGPLRCGEYVDERGVIRKVH